MELEEKSTEGVVFNCSQYLLNELLKDVEQVQEEPKMKLNYLWILILISFVVGSNPPDY